jgi:hypothetical protein
MRFEEIFFGARNVTVTGLLSANTGLTFWQDGGKSTTAVAVISPITSTAASPLSASILRRNHSYQAQAQAQAAAAAASSAPPASPTKPKPRRGMGIWDSLFQLDVSLEGGKKK